MSDRRHVQLGNAGATIEAAPSHETILQGLDQWVDTPDPWVRGGRVYYGADNFAGTEAAWDGVPIIYAPESSAHPHATALRDAPDQELHRIGGRVAGRLSGSRVSRTGTPRLTAQAHFDDPALQALYNQGRLGLSTGFEAVVGVDGRLYGQVEPSHVLAFDVSKESPNDPRAMFLNVAPGGASMTAGVEDITEIKGALGRILDFLKAQRTDQTNTKPGGGDVDKETQKKLDLANLKIEERDGQIAELKEQIAAYETKIAEFENLKKEEEQKRKDARWMEMKNILPAGATHKDEDEKALRSEFEADPAGFALKAVQMQNLRAPGMPKDGHTSTPSGSKSVEERLADVGHPSIQVIGGGS